MNLGWPEILVAALALCLVWFLGSRLIGRSLGRMHKDFKEGLEETHK